MTNIKSYLDGAGAPSGYKLLVPQCPNDVKWAEFSMNSTTCTFQDKPSSALAAVFDLLDTYAAMADVDANRIYVTGLSMGGHGTWDAICRRPDFFAAAMPICGGVDETTAELYRGLPLRFFHGSVDGAVPVGYSRRMDKALADAGIEHGYTEYPNVNHDCWTRTYANDDVLAWLFAQIRGR